jgi:hypothetical protein
LLLRLGLTRSRMTSRSRSLGRRSNSGEKGGFFRPSRKRDDPTPKNVEFNLDSLKDCVQIVAYVAKTIPDAFLSRPILDLEVFAILTSAAKIHFGS